MLCEADGVRWNRDGAFTEQCGSVVQSEKVYRRRGRANVVRYEKIATMKF